MYTIKEAALRAGVSIPLLRAWERRYGIVEPARTASGYRLYDDLSIERLRAMRHLVDSGWSPSQAARRIETAGIPPASPATTSPTERGETDQASTIDLAEAFVAAAAELDEARIEQLLDEVFASGSFERVVDSRLMPTLRALGEGWAAGVVSVGGEHVASHAVLRRLSASFDAAGRADGDRPVLVGLPPGSHHEIGALAFATAARRTGQNVVYLGANVPVESWIEAVRNTDASAAVIAVPTSADRAAAEDAARAIDGTGSGVLVAVGGDGSGGATLPASVLRLPDEIGAAARSLETTLAHVSRRGRTSPSG
jgi:DNA-binding transcriptional MerR regulator/methylmalonyl-CoA mutase cobalamin-binding subunit